MRRKAHLALVCEMKKLLLVVLTSCIVFDLLVMWMLWV
jgi:hypothetical protein